MTQKLKAGECLIEVFNSSAGPTLGICDDHTGYRLSGPKLTNGKPVFSFKVDVATLRRELDALYPTT